MDRGQWPFYSAVVRWTGKALNKLSLWKGEYHIVMTDSTAPWWQIDFRQYSWIVKEAPLLSVRALPVLPPPPSVSSCLSPSLPPALSRLLSHPPFSFPHLLHPRLFPPSRRCLNCSILPKHSCYITVCHWPCPERPCWQRHWCKVLPSVMEIGLSSDCTLV